MKLSKPLIQLSINYIIALKKDIKMAKFILKFLLYFLSALIYLSTKWISKNFGFPTTSQIIFQLSLMNKSISAIPNGMIYSYTEIIYKCLYFASFMISIEILIFIARNKYSKAKVYSSFIHKIDKFILSKLYISIFVLSALYFCNFFSLHHYFYEQFKNESLYKNYVNPKDVNITKPKLAKNLILIYMESLENTYRNKKIFGRNLLQRIDNIQATEFARYKQTLGTQWTIASQFSTQCGMPINIKYVDYNNICLTDILSNHGYYNIYLQGTSLDFTNKRSFLQKHNINKMFGKEELVNQGVRLLSDWGVYDDDLFIKAKRLIKEMHDNGKLFNLTILTGDTHEPGYASTSCKEKGISSISDIVECSSNQIADLVHFIIQNGYLNDTNIVLIGDHLFPRDTVFNNIPKNKRYILNRFISKDHYLPNREEILHMDMLPTILTFLGFKIQGERMGLGKSGFNLLK